MDGEVFTDCNPIFGIDSGTDQYNIVFVGSSNGSLFGSKITPACRNCQNLDKIDNNVALG